MAGNTNSNRFKRNAEAAGVEPKVVKPEVEENETVNAAETDAETPAAPQVNETPAPAPTPAPAEEPASSQENNMTVALNGMIDFEHRFKKREAKNKQIPLNITPTMNEQLQFLAEKNMIKSRNDFIFQLVESALTNIFSNQEIRDAFNQTRKWEK